MGREGGIFGADVSPEQEEGMENTERKGGTFGADFMPQQYGLTREQEDEAARILEGSTLSLAPMEENRPKEPEAIFEWRAPDLENIQPNEKRGAENPE